MTKTDTNAEAVAALPFTKPLDTDEFHQGVNYAMELACMFLGTDPNSFSWDAATEEFEGDVVSVLGNMFEASFGEDTNPDTLRALLAERERDKAVIEAAKVVLGQLDYWFDTDDDILAAMTPDVRADHERQHSKVRAALSALSAQEGK